MRKTNRKLGPSQIVVRQFEGTELHREQLAHLRIAHLTDLHFGTVTPVKVQQDAVSLVNQEKPDLVVITGDFVCHSQRHLDALSATLSKLEAPVIAVLGNHDYWSGAGEVEQALKNADVEVLKNQFTQIELRHQQLQVVGLDDAYTGHADRERALKGLRRDIASIGLTHIAEESDGLWDAGVPLVVAGHTHAGQVTYARIHELAVGRLVGHKYVHGLYGKRRGAPIGAVYVSAGIGASVVPLRLGDRGTREIAVFDLGHEANVGIEHHTEQLPLPGRKPSPERIARRRAKIDQKTVAKSLSEARAYFAAGKRQLGRSAEEE